MLIGLVNPIIYDVRIRDSSFVSDQVGKIIFKIRVPLPTPCRPSLPHLTVAVILKITYCLSLSGDKSSCLYLKFHPTCTAQRFILIGSVLGSGIHGYKLKYNCVFDTFMPTTVTSG